MSHRQGSLDIVETWPVPTASVGWCTTSDDEAVFGPIDHVFELASVSKTLTTYASLIALEEGSIDLDQPLGPQTSTVRHVLAHASGLGFEDGDGETTPTSRRVYSNVGFEQLGELIEKSSGINFHTYVDEAVFQPLGMPKSDFYGSPAYGCRSTTSDLLRFVKELLAPTLISHETLYLATTPHFAELDGILPGFGMQKPNLWGLGFELRGNKSPHWSGEENSAATFGHFGRSGTLLWVDPAINVGCVALADTDFGPWAKKHWPELCDHVISQALASS